MSQSLGEWDTVQPEGGSEKPPRARPDCETGLISGERMSLFRRAGGPAGEAESHSLGTRQSRLGLLLLPAVIGRLRGALSAVCWSSRPVSLERFQELPLGGRRDLGLAQGG